METATPGLFAHNFQTRSPLVAPSDLLYFSLVTLTTAGYGDILPISPLARICAALEAVTGVLYTTILIVRLVSAAPARTTIEPPVKKGERLPSVHVSEPAETA